MENDPFGLGDIEKRTRNAFRMAFSFLWRLKDDYDFMKKRIGRLEEETKELKKDLKNLTKIGDN